MYRALHTMGVAVNLHYIPIYRQPYYETLGFQPGYCKNAEKYFTQTLSLPMFASLCENSQAKVINSLKKILKKLNNRKQKQIFLDGEGNCWFHRNNHHSFLDFQPNEDRVLFSLNPLLGEFAVPGSRVLEIGCGRGDRLVWLEKNTLFGVLWS